VRKFPAETEGKGEVIGKGSDGIPIFIEGWEQKSAWSAPRRLTSLASKLEDQVL
jgi:hypothetical protein